MKIFRIVAPLLLLVSLSICVVAQTQRPSPAVKPDSGSRLSSNGGPASDRGLQDRADGAAASEAPKLVDSSELTSEDAQLTNIYRIGVGDVLDVRFLNFSQSKSTLYTVVDGGVIDLPVAGGPIKVEGLTTDEVQTQIASELRRRAVAESAQVSVGVRQFGSHSIVVTGLASSPGTKMLRREAVPLYVILAEVQPRLDASRVVVMRAGATAQILELSDSTALNFIIRPGDVLNLTSKPQEFYYIAGRVNYPGQKSYQSGITLLQAILAAGGTRHNGDSVELSREGDNGLLKTTKINLKEIKSGKVLDPKLFPGDRIEVLN
ncbi:MAG TPA: polysaccharide biosynthesis/export family protein [Pyrinomonadaceae bacterium]|nr:polysaccharide biosynthesis/export family protein [Pyrinomonadaceae bacterium]